MKKMLLSLALAGIAMTSCVKNEVQVLTNEEKGLKITFDSPVLYDNVSSKATVHGELAEAKYPKEESFIIYAAQHTGDFTGWPSGDNLADPNSTSDGPCHFNGTVISYNSSFDAWVPTYSNGTETDYYYWPQNKKMSFAAMSPAVLGGTATASYGANGLTVTNFVNPEVGEQYDMLFAKRTMNHTAEDMLQTADNYSGIPISFQHALSSIHFSIKKEYVEQQVYLKKIELTNVKNQGDFAENIAEDESTEYEIGTSVTPLWTVVNDSKVTYTPFDAKGYGKIAFPATPMYVSNVVSNIDEDDRKDMISHSLLVIPQEIGDDTQLKITYEIEETEKVKSYNLKGLNTLGAADGGITGGEVGQVNSWEIGHRYVYRIHYSATSEKKDIIYFSPEVDDWEYVQVIQIEL